MSIMNMNPKEAAQAWVAALRSGKYTQTTRRLRRPVTRKDDASFEYCCLGVAADLCVDKDRGMGWSGNYLQQFNTRTGCSSASLPWEIEQHLFGLKGPAPDKGTPLAVTYCIFLNDEQGFTFEQIADVIEAVLVNGAPLQDQPYYVEFTQGATQ